MAEQTPTHKPEPSISLDLYLQYCPLPVTVYIRVILRAIYHHNIIIVIQLLLRGAVLNLYPNMTLKGPDILDVLDSISLYPTTP